MDIVLNKQTLNNCLEACISTILQLKLESVPEYIGESWLTDLNAWLEKEHRVHLIRLKVDYIIPRYQFPHIAVGYCKRNFSLHAVVMKDGKVVFDPHPSNDGLITIEYILVFAKIFPVSF